MTTVKRGPKPKGCVRWAGDHWKARVVLEDGSRPWMHFGPEITTEAQARAKAVHAALRIREIGGVRMATPAAAAQALATEDTEAWSKRWLAARRERGQTTVDDDESRLKNHILPHLGRIPVKLVAKVDLERLVESLDAKILAKVIGWKTALHCWGLVTKMFDDASASKKVDLRCREDNPAAGVRGPERGDAKAKVYLYPSEFLQLVTCQGVSLRWRRIYAMAVYVYTRAGEQEALECEDLDLVHGSVHIHQAVDRSSESGEVKCVKTGAPRRIQLEPAVVPLLRALAEEAGGRGRLVHMPPVEDLAAELRKHLERAGVTRADLFTNDATRKWMTFHDLRATGITWMAVRGDAPLAIKQRAGHKAFTTTEGYIREAEAHRNGFGTVFPPLPLELLGNPSKTCPLNLTEVANPSLTRGNARRPQRDLNPSGGLDGVHEASQSAQDAAVRAPDATIAAPGEAAAARLETGSAGSPPVFESPQEELAAAAARLMPELIRSGDRASVEAASRLLATLYRSPSADPAPAQEATDEAETGQATGTDRKVLRFPLRRTP